MKPQEKTQKKRQFPLSLNQTVDSIDGDRQEFINLLPAPENPIDQQFQRELQERIQEVIDSPKWKKEHPKNRPNFNLSEFVRLKLLGKTHAEIAELLGIHPGYVGSHYERKFQLILQNLFLDLWQEL